MLEVTDATFRQEVRSARAVVVAFWAEWCSASVTFMPLAADLESNFGNCASFLAASIDDNPSAAEAASIKALPSVVLYRDGIRVATLDGARTGPEASRWLAARLSEQPVDSARRARHAWFGGDRRHFRDEHVGEPLEAAVGE
jgi:thioredoxin-like negative regulator of GroEL